MPCSTRCAALNNRRISGRSRVTTWEHLHLLQSRGKDLCWGFRCICALFSPVDQLSCQVKGYFSILMFGTDISACMRCEQVTVYQHTLHPKPTLTSKLCAVQCCPNSGRSSLKAIHRLLPDLQWTFVFNYIRFSDLGDIFTQKEMVQYTEIEI